MILTKYTESFEEAAPYRKAYLKGLDDLIAQRNAMIEERRNGFAADIFDRPEDYRKELANCIGWPLTEKRAPRQLEKTLLASEEICTIYRVTLEILPGLPFTGLFFEAPGEEKRPAVLSQHGGLGTPELCSSLYPTGSSNYNDQTQRLLRHGVHVFAPQLLLWREEDEDGTNRMEGERVRVDESLRQSGGSVTAVELYGLSCCIDWLCSLDKVDAGRIGMAGLSYGGMYTMLMTALDPRIRAAVSSSFFGAFASRVKSDWEWPGFGEKFLDAEIAALCWPRDISLMMGREDPLFDVKKSQAQYDRLLKLAGERPLAESVRFIPFKGQHEFNWDEEPVERMIRVLKA